jgi:hypothetical protein
VFRPSQLQIAKRSSVIFRCESCQENPGPGPTVSPEEFRTVISRGMCGARLSHLSISLIMISINKGYLFHIRQRRKNMVMAHDHLRRGRSCIKKAKGAEFNCRGDHRDLQVPSDRFQYCF